VHAKDVPLSFARLVRPVRMQRACIGPRAARDAMRNIDL
jgi:hypothetical protein